MTRPEQNGQHLGECTLDECILVVAPVGRDAPLACQVLEKAGFSCASFSDVEGLSEGLSEGAGAMLLTAAALNADAGVLTEALKEQFWWSNVPLVVLVGSGQDATKIRNILEPLGPGRNVTVLERPVRVPTLVTIMRSALRARRRQYQVRDLVNQLEEVNGTLEDRVATRTAALKERNRDVRSLVSDLTLAEQRERERISRVLHDRVQQFLVALQLRTRALRRGEADEQSATLDKMDEIIKAAINTTRTLTTDLNPPVMNEQALEVMLRYLAFQVEDRHGLQVTLDVKGSCRISDRDLRVLIFQLAQELLFNVVKHAGVARARVEAHEEDGCAVLRVSDDGAGFDPRKGEREGKREGLGLHEIRDRLRALDGRMEIDSAPGAGTQVTVRAPVEKAGRTPDSAASSAAAPLSHEGNHVAGDGEIEILLVDDHEVVRKALRNLLDGYADLKLAGEAADGPTALERVENVQPDVVVMDVSMPEMNGIEAVQHIHAKAPDVSTVVLTMYDVEDVKGRAAEAGASACLSKDCSTDALVDAIRRAARDRPVEMV